MKKRTESGKQNIKKKEREREKRDQRKDAVPSVTSFYSFSLLFLRFLMKRERDGRKDGDEEEVSRSPSSSTLVWKRFRRPSPDISHQLVWNLRRTLFNIIGSRLLSHFHIKIHQNGDDDDDHRRMSIAKASNFRPLSVHSLEDLRIVSPRLHSLHLNLFGYDQFDLSGSIGSLSELQLENSSHIDSLFVGFGSSGCGDVTNLRRLSINHFPKLRQCILPDAFSALAYLDLSKNAIKTFSVADRMCLHQLCSLDLSSNRLRTIDDSLCSLSGLETLRLAHNLISSFPAAIWRLQQLTTFELDDNQIQRIGDEISQLSRLRRLSCRDNLLSEICSDLGVMNALEELLLEGNRLEFVPKELGSLIQLKKLDLGVNNLSSLPMELSHLRQLTSLDLHDNQFNRVPEAVRGLSHLKVLSLEQNYIDIVPEWIGEVVSIEELYLGFNQIDSLPEEISNLTLMTYLDFSNNPIAPEFLVRKKKIFQDMARLINGFSSG